MLTMPVSARCKAWVCSHSLAGIARSNFAGSTEVLLLRLSGVVRYKYLCQADH